MTSAKIKNGAVTEAKIAAAAVTGAQVKSGSLTGTQINASTLGTVPSASQANTATTAINSPTRPLSTATLPNVRAGRSFLPGAAGTAHRDRLPPNRPQPQPALASGNASLSVRPRCLLKVATLSAGDEWTDEINTVTAENVYTVITVSPEAISTSTLPATPRNTIVYCL